MTLKPLHDRVVIKRMEAEETTKGGLVDGKEVKMIVKPGDKIICSKYMGTDVKVDGEQYTIVKQSDIVAIVED